MAAGNPCGGPCRHRRDRLHLHSRDDHRDSLVGRKKDPRPLQDRKQTQEEPGRGGGSGHLADIVAGFGKLKKLLVEIKKNILFFQTH